MYYNLWLSGRGRTDCLAHRHQHTEQHHRHAAPDSLAANESRQAGVGEGNVGFPHQQPGLLLRTTRRCAYALFRHHKGRTATHRAGNGHQYHAGDDYHRMDGSVPA